MNIRLVSAVLAFAIVGSATYAANPEVGGAPMFVDKNIVENAVNSADHTMLVAAVQAAGLVETLQGKGPFTVFAPTNEAFQAVPAATLDKLAKDPELLKSVLTYHVLPGRIQAASVDGSSQVVTLNGAKLNLSKAGDVVVVDEAMVTTADVAAGKGLIHVVDRVLMPPVKK